jgi:thiamine transport system permease protein
MSSRNKKMGSAAAFMAAALPCLLVAVPVLLRTFLDFSDASVRSGFLEAFASSRSWRILGFSLSQALLSAVIAVCLGFPAAYISASFDFPGKKILSSLFSLPFIVPSILLVLGLAGFFGNAGSVNALLADLGLPRVNFIYGIQGVILAHAFFNFPIAARLISASLRQADPNLKDAAVLLGAGRSRLFFTISLPESLPGLLSAFFLIFLYCFQSFTIILLLGGGPAFSTLEVEIYQAMRLTFRPGAAACYALLEILASLALTCLYAFAVRGQARRTMRSALRGLPRLRGPSAILSGAYLFLISLILGGPLVSILAQAMSVQKKRAGQAAVNAFSRFWRMLTVDSQSVLSAVSITLSVGLCAALAAVVFGLISANAARRSGRPFFFLFCAVIPLAVSPIVLSRSLSILSLFMPPLACLILFHAILALPLSAQFIYSGLAKLPRSLEEAAITLGATPLKALFTIKIPLLKRSLIAAFFFSFCVSASDLSGLLSLRLPGIEPLILRIYRLTGAYRFADACALGVLLLLITGIAFAFQEEK